MKAMINKCPRCGTTLPLGLKCGRCAIDSILQEHAMNWKHCTFPPMVVCLCGSTRFSAAFTEAILNETLAGKIVLTIGCNLKENPSLNVDNVKPMLDELHLRKIDLADEVMVLNVDGYIGASTEREIAYAIATGAELRFLNRELGGKFLSDNSHRIGNQVASFLEGKIPEVQQEKQG